MCGWIKLGPQEPTFVILITAQPFADKYIGLLSFL